MNSAEVTQATIFVILFGVAFLFAAEEEIGLSFLFCFLAFIWVLVAGTVIGDGGREIQVEKDRRKEYKRQQKNLQKKKENLKTVNVKVLFQVLDDHIEQLSNTYSKTTEKVLIGHKKEGEGTWLEIDVPQYDFRTRNVPEHLVKKKVLRSERSIHEQEIVRRRATILPELVAKYRTGKNIEITKRILEKIPPRKVGLTFEKYEMFQEAEQWFSSHTLFDDAKRVRNKMKMKIDQTVVQGDQVTKTEIKDSVLNRSNIGGSSKMQELRELMEMKKEGLISNEEYEKMKQEIIG